MAEQGNEASRPTPPSEVKIPDPAPISRDGRGQQTEEKQPEGKQKWQGMIMESATDNSKSK